MARSKVDAGPSPPEGNSFVFHQPRAGPTEPGMSRQLVSSVGPDWLKVLHAAEPIVSREVKQADIKQEVTGKPQFLQTGVCRRKYDVLLSFSVCVVTPNRTQGA